MKNLILIYVDPYKEIHTIALILLLLLLVLDSGLFFYSIFKRRRKIFTAKALELTFLKPKNIIQLQELPIGMKLIVLDDKTKLPIVQRIEDYDVGVKTKIFEKTFYLDKYGDDKLEKLRIYSIESIGLGKIRILEEVSVILNFCEGNTLNLN